MKGVDAPDRAGLHMQDGGLRSRDDELVVALGRDGEIVGGDADLAVALGHQADDLLGLVSAHRRLDRMIGGEAYRHGGVISGVQGQGRGEGDAGKGIAVGVDGAVEGIDRGVAGDGEGVAGFQAAGDRGGVEIDGGGPADAAPMTMSAPVEAGLAALTPVAGSNTEVVFRSVTLWPMTRMTAASWVAITRSASTAPTASGSPG